MKKENVEAIIEGIASMDGISQSGRTSGLVLAMSTFIYLQRQNILDNAKYTLNPWKDIGEGLKENAVMITKGISPENNEVLYGLTQFKDNGDMVHLGHTGKDQYVATQYRTLENFE